MIFDGPASKALGSILATQPDGRLAEKREEEDEGAELNLVAGEFIDAVHSRDPKAVVEAFRALWLCFEASEPGESSEY